MSRRNTPRKHRKNDKPNDGRERQSETPFRGVTEDFFLYVQAKLKLNGMNLIYLIARSRRIKGLQEIP